MKKRHNKAVLLTVFLLLLIIIFFLKRMSDEEQPNSLEAWKGTTDVVIVTTGTTVEGLTYRKSSDEVTVTGYIGEATEVVVPAKIDNLPVIAIENNAFEGLQIKKIEIKASVEEIPYSAFAECQMLEQVIFPDSVNSIGMGAFEGCISLETLELPSGVTKIASNTFYNSGIKTIELPENLEYIGGRAFSECEKLGQVLIPENVNSIGAEAFANSEQAEIYYPSNIAVGQEAFLNVGAQLEYTINDGRVTISDIEAGTEQLQIEVPSTIFSKPVAYITEYESYTELLILHTEHYENAGKVCTICGNTDGEEKADDKKEIVIIQKNNTSDKEEVSPSPVSDLDPIRGKVTADQGIITGAINEDAGDGYCHWKLDENGWWLQYANGAHATGRTVVDQEGTAHEVITWELVNGAWYAFGADGYAKSGWTFDLKLSGWFYVDINNGMKTGWQFIEDKWYYFNQISDGTMGRLHADYITPDGYYVGKNGAWIE